MSGPYVQGSLPLEQKPHRKFGLQPLAIVYSLPYARCSCGSYAALTHPLRAELIALHRMLGFFAAFLIFCFDNTDLVSRIPMGISALGTIAVVIVVYVLYAWEFKNGTSQQWFSLKKAFVKDRVEHTKGRL